MSPIRIPNPPFLCLDQYAIDLLPHVHDVSTGWIPSVFSRLAVLTMLLLVVLAGLVATSLSQNADVTQLPTCAVR